MVHLVEIVHAGAAERAIGGREPGRLDQIDRQAETGGQPHDRAGVLRDVGLEKGNAHERIRQAVSGLPWNLRKIRRGWGTFSALH